MSDSTPRIEQCPYCGKEATVFGFCRRPKFEKFFRIECIDCLARGPTSNDQDEAIDTWNIVAAIFGSTYESCA